MSQSATKAVSNLVERFLREHPEYAAQVDRAALETRLQVVFDAVLRGDYVAPTPTKLAVDSEAVGIERSQYLDLVNLTAHAATDRPVETS